MRGILFALLLLLVCGSRDLKHGSAPGVIRLFANGFSVTDITLSPADAMLNPPFNSSITNYTVDVPMCNRLPPVPAVGWNCSYNFTVYATSGVVNVSIPANMTRYPITLTAANIGLPLTVHMTVSDNGTTYDYYVDITLLPSKDAGLISIDTPGSYVTPPFQTDYRWAFLIGLNHTENNTIQVNPVVTPGATWNFVGIPASGAVDVTTACTPIPFNITVIAEDGTTTSNYSFSAFKPGPPKADSGKLDVELAKFLFNGTVTADHETEISGFIAELADIPPAYVVVYTLSVLQSTNETVVEVIFLPGDCGDPLTTENLAYRLRSNAWDVSPLFVELRDGTNQTVYITDIVSIVNSTQLDYCLNGYNATIYGPSCIPPPPPAKEKLSAEQGVAVATGVLVFIFIVVLIADSIHHKLNKLNEPQQDLELRERTSMKDQQREPSQTSPQSPSASEPTHHEDP